MLQAWLEDMFVCSPRAGGDKALQDCPRAVSAEAPGALTTGLC